jgi:DNA polymerase III delta subunit
MIQLNKKFEELWKKYDGNILKIEQEISKIRNNATSVKTANTLLTSFYQTKEFVNDFSLMDVLQVDDVDKYFYKQWQVQVFENSDPILLDYMTKVISANLSYTIVYNESVENTLDYYNLGNELRQMGFFSVEGNTLFFNVSLFIAVTYDGDPITNPEVKLQITIRPFLNVKS